MASEVSEAPPSSERVDRDIRQLESVVSQSGDKFLDLIKKKFHSTEKSIQERLPYHDEEHTKGVVDRVHKIIDGLRDAGVTVSPLQEVRTVYAAYGHDTMQMWMPDETGMKRQRMVGINEEASTEFSVYYMDAVNATYEKNGNASIFSGEDKEVIEEAIPVTEPAFGAEVNIGSDENPEIISTVTQPKLKDAKFIESKILALADMNSSGMESSEYMVREAQKIFQEDNIGLSEGLKNNSLTDEQKELAKANMESWLKGQIDFVRARDTLLDDQFLAMGVKADKIPQLRANVFNKFGEARVASETRYNQFKGLAEDPNTKFTDLLQFMGYPLDVDNNFDTARF